MKYHLLLAICGSLAIAGCTSTGSDTTDGSTVTAQADRGDMVGTWTGTLDGNAAVRVTVPASGNISYWFRGQRVPVSSSRKSGNSLISVVGAGGGTVTLSQSGDGLLYRYSFRGDRASATLTRS